MTTTNTGPNVIKALEALQEFGRMTAQEFADMADISRYDAHAVLSRMNKRTVAGEKRIHVADWTYGHDGARRYPRPVYALGDRPDKTKPKADVAANRRRYEQGKNRMYRMTSVFNLAMSRDKIREIRKVTT
jgi:hypothetical protein